MAFALLTIGIVMLIVAVKGTQGDLAKLVKGEFTQPPYFHIWIFAMIAIGMIGYVPKAKPISTALLGLVILVLFLSKGKGFFPQLEKGLLAQPTSAQTANNSTSLSLPGFPGVATHLIQ